MKVRNVMGGRAVRGWGIGFMGNLLMYQGKYLLFLGIFERTPLLSFPHDAVVIPTDVGTGLLITDLTRSVLN